MRSHHAGQPPPADPSTPWGVPIDEALCDFLKNEAGFVTQICTDEYSRCLACGRNISFAETIARPDPHHPKLERICWHCLIAILLYRGSIQPDDPDVPTLYLNSRAPLKMATLLADHPRERGLHGR